MKTADLVDAHGDGVRFCNLPFIKLGRRRAFHGEIATVSCFEDNAFLKSELQKPGKGRVMVVDGGGSTRVALMGDIMAEIARASGWAGAIVNGSARDSVEIDAMDFGLFCLALTPKKSKKDGEGRVGQPVIFGGVQFIPGEFVYCDPDGVLVSSDLYTQLSQSS